jgi:hypothetical protein
MLSDDAIERYARQIVVPGIGAAGQQRLLDGTAVVAGNARARRQAVRYLRAAGMRVVELPSELARAATSGEDAIRSATVAVALDAPKLPPGDRRLLLELGIPVCWYAAGLSSFSSGVHPDAPLPDAGSAAGTPDVHDAAACEAAALACAIVVGLPCRTERFDFRL